VLVFAGALTALVIVRIQLFSLALFPALLLLLRSETRVPSRRIWLVPPLLAVWSNLHGAVLVGLAAAGAYLVVERARRAPLEAGLVLLASLVAICVTPAHVWTPAYYLGVLGNEAAQRGAGLWAPLSLTAPFDVVLVVVAVVLVTLAVRARPELWQLIMLAGLAILSVRTARSGVWLLFAAAPLAATAIPWRGRIRRPRALLVGTSLVIIAIVGVAKGPLPSGADPDLVETAIRAAGGTPILAEPVPAEQIALAGGRIWLGNPIDAFRHDDQRLYLDWLEGDRRGDAALLHAPRIVLVATGGDPDRRLRSRDDLERVAGDDRSVVYRRLAR
jgi:hypothetical protein